MVRFRHDDPARIREYIRSLGPRPRVIVETTGNWYWLVDLIEEAGGEPHLANTVQTRQILKWRAKSDELDPSNLVDLDADGLLPEVYVPPRGMRDGRERHRWRLRVLGLRTRVKNAIHAILEKLNIESSLTDLFGKRGQAFLRGLELREPYQTELDSAMRLLAVLDEEVEAMRREIIRTLENDPLAELLETAPGIAELTAHLVLYEVGPVERFRHDKAFASYCSLAPGTWQSAERHRELPVGRHGNLYLKGAFVEAAWTAVRVDEGLGAFYRKLRRVKGSSRRSWPRRGSWPWRSITC